MNLRYIVPALGLVALSATASSAQEIAKGVFLNGWVDSIFSTTATKDAPTTNDFGTASDVKVGWNVNDRVSANINMRSDYEFSAFVPAEVNATVKATDQLSISAGRSYGPIGYYAAEPTGLLTVNTALTTALYSINPSGVWAVYTPTDKVTITFEIADGFYNGDGASGKPLSVNGHTDPNDVSYALDVVYNPTAEISLNLEGYIDPSAGGDDADGNPESVYQIGANAQYKNADLTAGGEFIYQSVSNYNAPGEDSNNYAWAAFISHTLPVTAFPVAATLQVSQHVQDKSNAGAGVFAGTESKVQLDLLTNPLNSSQFGLNFELFYDNQDPKASGVDSIDSFGFALEGLFVIP